MQDVLRQLNGVPGVLGSLVCGPGGELLAREFPPGWEEAALSDAARTLAESAAGLETVTGTMRMLDLRCAGARIVVRPIAGASVLFVCAPSMNLQPLAISASVAAPRLEVLVAARSPGGAARESVAPPAGGQLHATVQRINAVIERKKLDPFKTRGEIALKAGFALGFIDAETPDDREKLSKLKAVASAILREPV